MTILALTQSIRSRGYRANYLGMNDSGEFRVRIFDADRRNGITLMVPHKGLDEPGLVDYLIALYQQELRVRRRRREVGKRGVRR